MKRTRNDSSENDRKMQKSCVADTGVAGLPAKPKFSYCTQSSPVGDAKFKGRESADQASNVELFPGVSVNLGSQISEANQTPLTSTQDNSNTVSSVQPTPEALQLFGNILKTLQSQNHSQTQINCNMQPQHAPQYQNQYNCYPNQQFSGQYQGYQQGYNSGYNQQYYNQYNQYGACLQRQPSLYGAQTYPQQLNSHVSQPTQPNQQYAQDQDQSNALMNVFTKFLQNQQAQNNLGSAIPATSASVPQLPQKPTVAKNKTKRKKPKCTPAKEKFNHKEHLNDALSQNKSGQTGCDNSYEDGDNNNNDNNDDENNDYDDLIDEESEWGKNTIQGTNIIFENEEDIQKWIEERKKNWPTTRKVEEKKAEQEKAKKILETMTKAPTDAGNETTPAIRVCNFWMKTKRCRNGEKCLFSHDMADIAKAKAMNHSSRRTHRTSITKPLLNHKIKLVHGIPVQIPQRFTPLNNRGKSLHKLLVEGDQFKSENLELLHLFEKLLQAGVIKQDWDVVKKKLKLDDESLNLK